MSENETEEFPVSTVNEFAVHTGENLANHTASLRGQGKFIRTGVSGPLMMRTKQSVYRLCVYLNTMAEMLPDEPGEHTYEEVEAAIQNS